MATSAGGCGTLSAAGTVMTILFDDVPTFFTPKGLVGMSIEGGATGRVSLRDVWLKKL